VLLAKPNNDNRFDKEFPFLLLQPRAESLLRFRGMFLEQLAKERKERREDRNETLQYELLL
jgi:hypothetical protein